jgi:hypothetical protein
MRDLSDLARSASATADALPAAQRRGVQKAALLVTTAIRSEILSATGDMRLSGVGRRGAKVGAKFDIKGTANPTALITATGPLHLIERDTQPHDAPRRRSRGRRRYVAFGGNVYSRATGSGGSRGKHPFEKGWKRAGPQTPEIFQREVREAVRKAWR